MGECRWRLQLDRHRLAVTAILSLIFLFSSISEAISRLFLANHWTRAKSGGVSELDGQLGNKTVLSGFFQG